MLGNEKQQNITCPLCESEMFERADGSWKCSKCYWWEIDADVMKRFESVLVQTEGVQ